MHTYEPMSKLLKGGQKADHIGTIIGVIKGDTSSLDYNSHVTEPYSMRRCNKSICSRELNHYTNFISRTSRGSLCHRSTRYYTTTLLATTLTFISAPVVYATRVRE